MNYVKPPEIVTSMIQAGDAKASLPIPDLLIRGILAGGLLGISTTLAISGGLQSIPLVGAAIFPVGFVIIVLLGLELVTGNFALLPLAAIERKSTVPRMLAAFGWVFLGNLLGSLAYAWLFWISQSMAGETGGGEIAGKIIAIAEAKTTGYAAHGAAGMAAAFTKAVLCNWMVCFGVVMAMTSSSTSGKILACWLPIFIFFAQGFEHAVVNMFVIPCGMMFGAKVTIADWWLSNQLIVTLGNFAGGLFFTGLAIYCTHRKKTSTAPRSIAPPEEIPAAVEPDSGI